MSTRVFLGNIPYNITEEELSNELSQLGHPPAEVKVVKDRDTGQGRGFAFAEYGTTAAATAAIAAINGAYVHNRPIRADHATERTSGGGGGGGHGRGGGGGGGGRSPEGRRREDQESWRDERRSNRRKQW